MAYLASVEPKKEKEKEKRINEYKLECDQNEKKIKEKRITKIEKIVDKEYYEKLRARDRIEELLQEIRTIPEDIEKLKVAEYMLYRVDIISAERIVKKAIKSLGNIYNDIQQEIENLMEEFEDLDYVQAVDYSEYNYKGNILAEAKEKFKLEYTEEERRALIQNQLDIVDKAMHFNTLPIPYEILKNSDRDIQSKLPKFNNIRQKRIKILSTMKEDYEKVLDPKEILCIIDDAIDNLSTVQNILTTREYKSIRKKLILRRKIVFRGTNDIRSIIETKEKKTGIINFKIQEARYQRMETLRNIIAEATSLIEANPTTNSEDRLRKLKNSYEREKQFASVIENLESEAFDEQEDKLKILRKQIDEIQNRVDISKNVITEQEEKIKKAKGELIILWKMEINSTLSRKKEEVPELPAPKEQEKFIKETQEIQKTNDTLKNTNKLFNKLKKVQGGKHACT